MGKYILVFILILIILLKIIIEKYKINKFIKFLKKQEFRYNDYLAIKKDKDSFILSIHELLHDYRPNYLKMGEDVDVKSIHEEYVTLVGYYAIVYYIVIDFSENNNKVYVIKIAWNFKTEKTEQVIYEGSDLDKVIPIIEKYDKNLFKYIELRHYGENNERRVE